MAAKSVSARLPGLLFGVAVLTTLPILWIYVVPVLGLQFGEHQDHALPLLIHAVGGVAMLVLGAAALYIGWTRRAFRRHRWFGYSYLIIGAAGAIAALLLSVKAPHEPRSLYVATGTLAAVWLGVAAMAYRAAVNKRFDSHREWMVRSYVLSWTFVGCRMANLLNLFPVLEQESVTAQIWLFWIGPLILCEFALQWRCGSKSARSSASE